jgi:D-galactose 1-dehydrogenase/L-arabinose 1- dehydrogenase
MPPIRLGLIGIGKIARDQHLPAIAADPRFELVATASPHGRVDGIPGYGCFEEMLAAGQELDAVSIATPPVGRHAIAASAIDAGLDVMLEKPPVAGLAEASALKARAAAAGTVLFASWHSREAAGVAAAREWLAERQVRQAAISWKEDIRRWHPGQDWILGPGGFGVFDPGINALSILTAILAEPVTVESAELAIPANREAPLAASARMRSGTADISVELDFLHLGEPCWNIDVETDGGRLSLRQGGGLIEIGGSTVAGLDEEYPRLYSRFAELIEARQSDVDVAPLRLVADAILIASRRTTPDFNW